MVTTDQINRESNQEPQLVTLEEFWDWYPDGYKGRFELHNGVIVKMQPTGIHEQVAGFLASKLSVYIDRFNLPYFIPRQGLIKAIDSDKSAYIPDVMLLDSNQVKDNEPFWKTRSTLTQGSSIKLAIEVVSTNWRDDYLMKLGEYEKLGIEEYWIVDYLGLGGRRYIGNPKQPTISIFHLEEGEYTLNLFQGEDRVRSMLFPELSLTAQQIFEQGK